MSTRDTSHFSDISKMKTEADGQFKRRDSSFRNFIEKGGKFAPETGRYHLIVSLACPWATRTIIFRKLKKLESIIPLTVVSPRMGALGWPFKPAEGGDFPGAEADPLYDSQHVRDLYFKADPDYEGRFTVPVLWDKKEQTIVNNESSEIIRIFNSAFNELEGVNSKLDLYPSALQKEIDEVNSWVYDTVNNGVYKSGFATSQSAYEANVGPLFASLDRLEKMLEGKDYLIGNTLTEADVRLWVTIIRFDPVYVGHFKCNYNTIRAGYPNINRWMKKLYWGENAFKSSTDFAHIKTHYYWSHPQINPTRIVPQGPKPDIEEL